MNFQVAASLLGIAAILLTGCAVPGYPYSGGVPYGAVPPGSPYPQAVPAPGMTYTAPPAPFPYVYAPAPVLIAPTFYAEWGNGYWYGNRYWPYRPGCAFYGGRYYGGYQPNYWRGNNGNWQGGNRCNNPWQGNRGGYGGCWWR
jgi:hypothetical protein